MALYAPQYGRKKRVIRDDDGKTTDAARANQGKKAEDLVRGTLNKLHKAHPNFDFQRLYDAHTANGIFPAQIADFLFFLGRVHGTIEVKEVKHDFRLPKKNFPLKKQQALLRREQAGGKILIFIRFMPLDIWRSIPLSLFLSDSEAASWDLRSFEILDFKQISEQILGGKF